MKHKGDRLPTRYCHVPIVQGETTHKSSRRKAWRWRALRDRSPPAECRDQLQIGPRTRVRDDGASGSSFWKIMAALSVLGQKGFYRHRRGPRRCPGGRGGPHPWVHPPALLRIGTSSWRIKNPQKFPARSENISRSKFLKQKDSKNSELALGILSIG